MQKCCIKLVKLILRWDWGVPLRPMKSHEHLVLCWAKCASELSPQLHEIILTLDSLQWQRAFWMWCPISQLFNVNYQPTTCQTLTIKMSATKISPLQKERWNLLSEGMKPTKLLRCYYGLFHALRACCRGMCCLLVLIRVAVKSHHVDNPTHLKQSFALTSPLSSEWRRLIYESVPP